MFYSLINNTSTTNNDIKDETHNMSCVLKLHKQQWLDSGGYVFILWYFMLVTRMRDKNVSPETIII